MSLTFLGGQNGRAAKRAQKREKETDLLFTTWMEFLIVVESWVGSDSNSYGPRISFHSYTPTCRNRIIDAIMSECYLQVCFCLDVNRCKRRRR
jgi:hypothetical protein